MPIFKYRSKLEAQIASHLKRGGVQFGYETVSFPYTRECKYTPDFVLPAGVILEAKGWFRPEDRTKLLAVKTKNPDLDIRLVFQNARNRLSRKSKTTYGEWASKNGFPFSDGGRVPADWLKEGNGEIQRLDGVSVSV